MRKGIIIFSTILLFVLAFLVCVFVFSAILFMCRTNNNTGFKFDGYLVHWNKRNNEETLFVEFYNQSLPSPDLLPYKIDEINKTPSNLTTYDFKSFVYYIVSKPIIGTSLCYGDGLLYVKN
jgi:hypothetical protein